jgi:hypothetical protein
MRADWTVAIDDMVCVRFRTCIECGRAARHLHLGTHGLRAWCIPLCAACGALDPQCQRVLTRLAARAGVPSTQGGVCGRVDALRGDAG